MNFVCDLCPLIEFLHVCWLNFKLSVANLFIQVKSIDKLTQYQSRLACAMHCKFNCSKMIQISSEMRTENILQTKNSFTSCIFAEFHYKFYGHFDKISRQLKLGSKLTRKNSNNSNKVFCATRTFQHGCSAKGFSHNFIIALQKGQL